VDRNSSHKGGGPGKGKKTLEGKRFFFGTEAADEKLYANRKKNEGHHRGKILFSKNIEKWRSSRERVEKRTFPLGIPREDYAPWRTHHGKEGGKVLLRERGRRGSPKKTVNRSYSNIFERPQALSSERLYSRGKHV